MGDWQESMPQSFCEGYLWKQMIPGFDEFFNGLSGFAIILMGVFGLFQMRLEILTKLMYAGVIVSGVGTIMLHWRRIVGFNLADTIPLLVTLTFGIIAFFDEIVFEYRRVRSATGNLLPVRDLHLERNLEWRRSFLQSLFYTLCITYLCAGVILLIFSDLAYIFGLYFGVPFGIFAIGGIAFISFQHRRERLAHSPQLLTLGFASIVTGLTSIVFKVIDSSFCNQATVFLLPHALFHILLTYSTHCLIVFLTFYRANNFLFIGEGTPKLRWRLFIFPMVEVPLRSQFFKPYVAPANAETSYPYMADPDDPPPENPHPRGGGRRLSLMLPPQPQPQHHPYDQYEMTQVY